MRALGTRNRATEPSEGYNDLAQNAPAYSVKWAGSATIAASRRGSVLTLTAKSGRYSSADRYVGYPGAIVDVQRYIRANRGKAAYWQTVRRAHTNRYATYTFSYVVAPPLYYRTVSEATGLVTSGVSGNVAK